ncbi:MAG: hypothetical protein ACPGSM_06040 [Thiolinea sp.]
MSSESMNMDWLDQNNLKSVAARRFAEFCQQDIEAYDDPDDPDKTLYQEASMLILQRIEKAVTGD